MPLRAAMTLVPRHDISAFQYFRRVRVICRRAIIEHFLLVKQRRAAVHKNWACRPMKPMLCAAASRRLGIFIEGHLPGQHTVLHDYIITQHGLPPLVMKTMTSQRWHAEANNTA